MDKEFLIRILHTSSRVILPGFGAFLRKTQGGSVVFTPFLKSDDGFLSNELMSEFGISKEDSMEMIEAYVGHIKATLDKSGRYAIEGAGSLTVDSNGSIAFSEDMTRQIPSPKPAVVVETPEIESPTTPPVPPVTRESYAPPRPINTTTVPPVQPSAVAPKPITNIRRTTPPPAPTMAIPVQPQQSRVQRPMQQPQPSPRPTNTRQPQPQRRPNPAQRPQQPQLRGERPLPRSPKTPQKGKYDVWLIVAIIAALVAIGLLIFGFVTSSSVSELQL